MSQNSFFSKGLIISTLVHGIAFAGIGLNFEPAKINFFNDITGVKISTLRVLNIESQSTENRKVNIPNFEAKNKDQKTKSIAKSINKEKKLKKAVQQSRGLGEHHKTQVRIVQAPKPPYPFRARKLGFEGEVELAITIGKDGFVKTGNIIRSSGRNDCDSSALDTVLSKWRFSPATFSGIPIESKEQVVVRFQLR